jgi:hypothetical protein
VEAPLNHLWLPDLTDGIQRVHIVPFSATIRATHRLPNCACLHVELPPFDIAVRTEWAGNSSALDVGPHLVLPAAAAYGAVLLMRVVALAGLGNCLRVFVRVQQVIGDVTKQLIACVRHDLRALVFSKLIHQEIVNLVEDDGISGGYGFARIEIDAHDARRRVQRLMRSQRISICPTVRGFVPSSKWSKLGMSFVKAFATSLLEDRLGQGS